MKMTNRSTGGLVVAFALALTLHSNVRAQELRFTDVRATEERAVQIHWQSETNTVYRVEYADELLDVSLGGPAWKKLFDNYPSHGTNTFILDSGNYDESPAIPHPKCTLMRFYRIFNLGTNTSVDNPVVAITSPSNGAALSGEATISVSAFSDQVLNSVKLYVDGEEMYDSDDGTNFVINTCEWPNGPHVLFAVAKSQSGWTGLPGDNSVTSGSAVSAYVNVTFSNLITRYDFVLPFFDPDQGQTQAVSAVFAANVNWTLEVQDASSNTVRSTTGSGSSMMWDFDGYDSNGVKLTPAFYWYVLTAQTNGQQMMMIGGGDSFSASAGLLSDTTELWAMQDSGVSVPLAIYPPGFDTNRLNIFEASQSEVFALNKAVLSLNMATIAAESRETDSGGAAGAAAYGGPASQSTKGPQRKPKEHHIGVKGSFGVLYQDAALHCYPPPLTIHLPPYYVRIDGAPNGSHIDNDAEPRFADVAKNFVTGMKNSGYTNSWIKGSGQWTINDLKGAGASINSVNFGLVVAHASYADTYENVQEGILHTYTWLSDGTFVRLGDMRLGGSGPNGLRWLTMLTCNTLRDQNLQTYINRNYLPLIIGNNLHLLLSAETIMSGTEETTRLYAQKLKKGDTIPDAWVNALKESISKASEPPSGPRVARILGHPPCLNDKLMDWQDPDTGITSRSVQVYPTP